MPSSRDLLNPGIKRTSPVSPTLAGSFFSAEPLGKPIMHVGWHLIDFHQGSLSFLHIYSAAWNWLLFSHIGFSLRASAGFPTDHEQNNPVVFKIGFLWQKPQREVMLIMQFSWENLDTITLLPLPENS